MGVAEPEQLTVREIRWSVEPGYIDALRDAVLGRIGGLDDLPGVELMKRTVRRRLYRVPLPDGRSVLVKLFGPRSRWDRVLRACQPCRARCEWTASHRLRALGIPASRVVALGYPTHLRWDLMACLVVDPEPDVIAPGDRLRELDTDAERLDLFRGMARFIRRFHDAGVRQHDLHTGNLLLRRSAEAAADRFVLIDLQRVRFGAPPSASHRAASLAQFLSHTAIPGIRSASLVETVLAAYREADPPLASPLLSPAAIARRIEHLEAVRLRSRSRRCLLNTSQFIVERVGDCRIYRRRSYAADELLAIADAQLEATTARDALPAVSVQPRPGQSGPVRLKAGLRTPPEGGTTSLGLRVEPGHADERLEVASFPPGGSLSRLFPTFRPPGLAHYAAAHRRHVEDATSPHAIAAILWLRGPHRGSSVAIVGMPGD